MPDILHHVGIKAPKDNIYKALTTIEGLSQWWTRDTRGSVNLNGKLEFRFEGSGPDFKVAELRSNEKVVWHCTDSTGEWLGTKISFNLTDEENGEVSVLFKHSDWKEATEMMAHCSTKWAVFMLSLKEYLETGKGRPFPEDIPINHQ